LSPDCGFRSTIWNKDFIEYFTGLIKGRERTRNQDDDAGQGDRQDVGYRVDFVEKGRKFSTGILTEIKKTIGLSHYIN
jgi:hypothetical protein